MFSPEQHKWVTKMLGYDYEIIYKKGNNNAVADALSHQYEDEGSMLALSSLVLDWLDEAHQKWLYDTSTIQLIHKLQKDPNQPQGYSWTDSTLKNKGRLVLVPTFALKNMILMKLHSYALVGHS